MGAKRVNPRQPKGIPAGGQFAEKQHGDDTVTLRQRAIDAVEAHATHERASWRASAKYVATALLAHEPNAATLVIEGEPGFGWNDSGAVRDVNGVYIGDSSDFPGGLDLLALGSLQMSPPMDRVGSHLVPAAGLDWLDIPEVDYDGGPISATIDLRAAAALEL